MDELNAPPIKKYMSICISKNQRMSSSSFPFSEVIRERKKYPIPTMIPKSGNIFCVDCGLHRPKKIPNTNANS